MDMRVRVTRSLIENSFMELLKKLPFRKITVTKICENAQINRVTFYKHYLDTVDLYEKTVAELMDRSAADMEKVYKRYDLKAAIRSVFQNIYDNADKFTLLFSENVDSFYRIKNIRSGMNRLSEVHLDIPDGNEQQQALLKTFLSAGGSGVLFSWIRDGMKQSPTEVADALYDFIRRIMATYSVRV